MRLDQIIKYSGIIPKRNVAKYYCENGNAFINGRVGKATSQVKDGDNIVFVYNGCTYDFIAHIKVDQEQHKIFLSFTENKKEEHVAA